MMGGIFSPHTSDIEAASSRRPRHRANALLFVCTANVSRSPFAELVLRRRLGAPTSWIISSAGVPGTDRWVMDPQMSEMAQERGVPRPWCEAHRSRSVDPQMLLEHDLIITMEKRHRDAVLDLEPRVHSRVFTLAQAGTAGRSLLVGADSDQSWELRELVMRLHETGVVARSGEDVPDPYRRPRHEAERVAAALDEPLVTLARLMERTV